MGNGCYGMPVARVVTEYFMPFGSVRLLTKEIASRHSGSCTEARRLVPQFDHLGQRVHYRIGMVGVQPAEFDGRCELLPEVQKESLNVD